MSLVGQIRISESALRAPIRSIGREYHTLLARQLGRQRIVPRGALPLNTRSISAHESETQARIISRGKPGWQRDERGIPWPASDAAENQLINRLLLPRVRRRGSITRALIAGGTVAAGIFSLGTASSLVAATFAALDLASTIRGLRRP